MKSSRTGRQEPRIRLEPRRDSTDGPDAARFAAAYGLAPDPWQATILDAWLGRDAGDLFTATTCGLAVPRQNGKNAVLEMREFYGLCILGEQILHSAHEVKTAAESFRRLSSFFENERQYPELASACRAIRRTNGQEAIELENGGCIRFSARSRGASRGMTFDLVVYDEAQELTDEQLEATMSTMAAAPLGNRQMILTGTPPGPSSPGTVFQRIRRDAMRGDDERLAWHEWSIPEFAAERVSDRDVWYETNPALGIRLDESYTEEEFRRMSADGFARERLGWWADMETRDAVFSEDEWRALEGEPKGKDPKERLAYGVKFSVDGSMYSISAAVRHPERKTWLELVEYGAVSGRLQHISDWLCERKDGIAVVVVDGRANTAALIRKMLDGGFPRKAIIAATPNEVASASSFIYNAVKERTIEHYGQGALDESAIHSRRRRIGGNGGWGFESTSTGDSTPIESASLAYWGVMTTHRRPGRKARIF